MRFTFLSLACIFFIQPALANKYAIGPSAISSNGTHYFTVMSPTRNRARLVAVPKGQRVNKFLSKDVIGDINSKLQVVEFNVSKIMTNSQNEVYLAGSAYRYGRNGPQEVVALIKIDESGDIVTMHDFEPPTGLHSVEAEIVGNDVTLQMFYDASEKPQIMDDLQIPMSNNLGIEIYWFDRNLELQQNLHEESGHLQVPTLTRANEKQRLFPAASYSSPGTILLSSIGFLTRGDEEEFDFQYNFIFAAIDVADGTTTRLPDFTFAPNIGEFPFMKVLDSETVLIFVNQSKGHDIYTYKLINSKWERVSLQVFEHPYKGLRLEMRGYKFFIQTSVIDDQYLDLKIANYNLNGKLIETEHLNNILWRRDCDDMGSILDKGSFL